MKSASLFLAVFFFLHAELHASIGETLHQCVARYGESKGREPDTDIYSFEKDGLRIAVNLHEGVVDSVMVFRDIPPIDGKPTPLTKEEISKFLAENAGSSTWTELEPVDTRQRWLTADKERAALYDGADYRLTIMTKGFMERTRAKQGK